MTTTRKPRTSRKCAECAARGFDVNASRDVAAEMGDPHYDMCRACYEYAGWENTHSDYGHETGHASDDDMRDCPVCHSELDKRPMGDKAGTGHSKGIAKSHTSHAGCKHAPTKAARAACRKARAVGSTVIRTIPANGTIEAVCNACGDTFIPDGPKDLTHIGCPAVTEGA